VTPLALAGLFAGLYVAVTLAHVTAYYVTQGCDQLWRDRQWRRERAAMDAAHAKARGTPPRGGKR
jgi:hypothetical protein